MGRLLGYRPPLVRKSLDRSRIKAVYLSSAEGKEFFKGLEEFAEALKRRR